MIAQVLSNVALFLLNFMILLFSSFFSNYWYKPPTHTHHNKRLAIDVIPGKAGLEREVWPELDWKGAAEWKR